MGRPSVDISQNHAEWHIECKIFHVQISVFSNRPVIEHKKYPGDYFYKEQEKRHSSKTPGKAYFFGVDRDLRGMNMKKYIGPYLKDPVPDCILISVTEDRFI